MITKERKKMSVEEEKEVLEDMLRKFEKKVEEDESLEDKMEGFQRDIQVDFDSGNQYNLSIDGVELSDIEDGPVKDADIVLSSSAETLRDLLEGEIGAMQAYASNKIKVDASLTDMLKFKKLF
ncbi:MAG: SCP2 sterol-binding domain-containing protein [Thermoplasmata archaeon]